MKNGSFVCGGSFVCPSLSSAADWTVQDSNGIHTHTQDNGSVQKPQDMNLTRNTHILNTTSFNKKLHHMDANVDTLGEVEA